MSAHQFVKVDLPTNTAKSQDLITLAGMEFPDDCNSHHPPQSCNWYASEARLDLKNGRLYFVTPGATPGDVPEAGEDETDSSEFAVWGIRLPEMALAKKIEIPASRQMPTILLTPDGKRLFASYEGGDAKHWTVETIDATTLTKINAVKDTGGNILDDDFPTSASFVPSGKFIVNGNMKIRMEGGQFRVEDFDPRTKLSAADLKKLSGFEKTDTNGRKFLPAMAVAPVKNKMLEWVINDAETETGFWTVDLETGETSSAVVIKSFARARLIGDGKEFAVFEGRMKPATPEEGPKFLSTGRISIYRVDSGTLAREFNIAELKGDGEMLCTSGDGTLAAYRYEKELMILNLQTGRVARVAGTVADFPSPGYQGACAFGE
ncbi:MAG TPA: hypothetical protein VKH63_08160 [Candidatus Acidoferrum sp.]|nr:hypothetical protein [Candidatus Acidoferrum sp.]